MVWSVDEADWTAWLSNCSTVLRRVDWPASLVEDSFEEKTSRGLGVAWLDLDWFGAMHHKSWTSWMMPCPRASVQSKVSWGEERDNDEVYVAESVRARG